MRSTVFLIATFAAACNPQLPGDSDGGSGGLAGAGSGGAAGSNGNGGAGGGNAGGGATGSGGMGGHPEDGFAWYEDPEVWSPIPGGEFLGDLCHPLQADPEQISRKILEWEPCGPGCEKASLDFGFGLGGGGLPVASTADVDGVGTGFISLGYGIIGEPRTRAFRYTIRLDDGMLIGVAQVDRVRQSPAGYSYCGFGRSYRSALATIAAGNTEGTRDSVSSFAYGLVDPTTGMSRWFAPWQTQALCDRFPVETPEGPTLFFNCGGAGYVSGSSDNLQFVSADGSVIAGSGSGYRDTAVWSEYLEGGNSRVRAWTQEGGVRTLIDRLPGIACEVAISSTGLAGFLVPPEGACNAIGPGLRIWYAPRMESGRFGDARISDPLAGFGLVASDLSVWGDYAVIFAMDEFTRQEFGLVIRLSDWEVRRIVPLDGLEVHFDTAIATEQYVYWSEGANVKSYDRVSAVYRWDLAHFDELGEPFDGAAVRPAESR